MAPPRGIAPRRGDVSTAGIVRQAAGPHDGVVEIAGEEPAVGFFLGDEVGPQVFGPVRRIIDPDRAEEDEPPGARRLGRLDEPDRAHVIDALLFFGAAPPAPARREHDRSAALDGPGDVVPGIALEVGCDHLGPGSLHPPGLGRVPDHGARVLARAGQQPHQPKTRVPVGSGDEDFHA